MADGCELFPAGAHAQITGLASKPTLNDEHCVSKGVNPDNAERLLVVTRTGAQLSLRPANLKPAELLPGSHVILVGLTNAAQFNGRNGEVVSWQGDRWIVDLDGPDPDKKERKSFKPDNLVIIPERVGKRKKEADAPEVEGSKLSKESLKALESSDENVVAKALLKCIREYPVLQQKCICVLATKQTVTVLQELATHLTDKQNDGLLRRALRPGDKVKGIEEMDAMEQCLIITERRVRSLAAMVRINYCDMLGFLKHGLQEPKFNRAAKAQRT